MIAYAKGARTFERHIDIDHEGVPVSAYCTQPHQADEWFKAFNKAKEMCGGPAEREARAPEKEVRYLDALVRGVYARRDLPAGHVLTDEDVYLAVPLLKGQISSREFVHRRGAARGGQGGCADRLVAIDADYASDPALQAPDRRSGDGIVDAAEIMPPRRRLNRLRS